MDHSGLTSINGTSFAHFTWVDGLLVSFHVFAISNADVLSCLTVLTGNQHVTCVWVAHVRRCIMLHCTHNFDYRNRLCALD